MRYVDEEDLSTSPKGTSRSEAEAKCRLAHGGEVSDATFAARPLYLSATASTGVQHSMFESPLLLPGLLVRLQLSITSFAEAGRTKPPLEPTGRPNVTEGLRLINCTTNITFPLHIVQTQNIIFTSQARQESSPTTGIRFNPKRYEFFLPFALLEATADDRRAGNQYLSLRKSINRVPRGAPRDEQDGFSDGKFEAGTSSSGRDVNAALKGFRSVRSAIIQSPLVTGATGPSMLALISLRLSFHAQSTQNSVKKDQYRLHGPHIIRVSYVISPGLVSTFFIQF